MVYSLRVLVVALIIFAVHASLVYGDPTVLSRWGIVASDFDADECHKEADTFVCRKIAILGSRAFTADLDQNKIVTVSFSDVEGVSEIDLVMQTKSGIVKKQGSIVAGKGSRAVRFDLTDNPNWNGLVNARILVVLKGKSIRFKDLKVSFDHASLEKRLSIFFETFFHPVLFPGSRPNWVVSPRFFGSTFCGRNWRSVACGLPIVNCFCPGKKAVRRQTAFALVRWCMGFWRSHQQMQINCLDPNSERN